MLAISQLLPKVEILNVSFIDTVGEAMTKVEGIDLSPISYKLNHEASDHWDAEKIANAEKSYRYFLALHLLHGKDTTIVPNEIIDEYWHRHILDTRKYTVDCEQLFGEFLHHDPYFGIGSDEAVRLNREAFEKTKELWYVAFGEPLLGEANPCSSTDCR